jgi:ribonuclease P protein component
VEARGVKLLYRSNGGRATRMAVVVARGCGGAVARNREKRITREAYRSLKEAVSPGTDLVLLIVRFGAPYAERRAALAQVFGRAGFRTQAD